MYTSIVKRLSAACSALALVFVFATCGEGGSFDISPYTGAAYEGELSGTATPPGGQPESQGPFSSSFRIESQSGGRVRADLMDTQTDVGFAIRYEFEGTLDENAVHFDLDQMCLIVDDEEPLCGDPSEGDQHLSMTIGAGGTIDGSGYLATVWGEGDITLSGQITPSSFDLVFEGETTVGEPGFPEGTEVRIVYDLSR